MINKKKKQKAVNPNLEKESGLFSFVERPLPDDNEVNDFKRAVDRELKEQEIDSHLLDVYSDKKGGRVDVSRLNIRKGHGSFFSLMKYIFILFLVSALGYYGYTNYFAPSGDISSLELKLSAPERIIAGQEFSYLVEYNNPSKYDLDNLYLELQYPDNFVFLSASVDPGQGNYGFDLPLLHSGMKKNLVISGYIINSIDSVNLAVARLSYNPGEFSVSFKKESSVSTIVNDLGFIVSLNDKAQTIFINQENNLKIFLSGFDDRHLADVLKEFDLSFIFKEGSSAELVSATSTSPTDKIAEEGKEMEEKKYLELEKLSSFTWRASNLDNNMSRQEAMFKYKVKNKVEDFQLEIRLSKKVADKDLVFWREVLSPEIISSDLSLDLFLNKSKDSESLDFGSPLDFSLKYKNNGSKSYKDVVIMATLKGDLVDWNSLEIGQNGEVGSGLIIWSKKEIPALAEIKAGQSSVINFSLKLKEFKHEFLSADNKIFAYAQYSVAGQDIKGNENISNKIEARVNSDLILKEELRYFNDDNYPVGSGPLPPKVDEVTELRVYWTIENNLHDLREVKAVFNLPAHVSFVGREELELGRMTYDQTNNQIVWDIGTLPTSKYELKSSFSVAISPDISDLGKILVVSSGSTVSAIDTETNGMIIKKNSSKTTRLEDDEIAAMNNSGIVVR